MMNKEKELLHAYIILDQQLQIKKLQKKIKLLNKALKSSKLLFDDLYSNHEIKMDGAK
jgi:hypothetical protein